MTLYSRISERLGEAADKRVEEHRDRPWECDRGDEIEELVFGCGGDIENIERAQSHLAECQACRRSHARLVEERALFECRAQSLERNERLEPAPDFTATVVAAADEGSLRWGRLARATRGLAAMAACAAAIVSVAHFEAPRYLEATANASESMTMSRDDGEPLACELPASGSFSAVEATTATSPAAMSAASEPLASVMIKRVASFSADLRWSYDDRVTFSRARP